MADKDFPTDFNPRGTVKTTDKLMIHNIDTGLTEYTTVADLFATVLANPQFTGNINNLTIGGALKLTRNTGSATLNCLYFANSTNDGVGDILYLINDGSGGIKIMTNGSLRVDIDGSGNINITGTIIASGTITATDFILS